MSAELPRTAVLRLYRRAFREARPYWPHLALVLLVGLVWLPVALLLPLPVRLVVDSVIGQQPLPEVIRAVLPSALAGTPERLLAAAVGGAVVLALLSAAHQYGDWLLRDWVAERMVLDFRRRLLRRSYALAPDAEGGSGDPAHRINNDAPALQWTALYGVIPLIVSGLSLAGVLGVTAQISPGLAALAFVTAVPVLLLVHLSQSRLRGRWSDVRGMEGRAFGIVQETLSAARIVTIFGQEEREADRYAAAARAGFAARNRVIRIEGLLSGALGLAAALGSTAILYLGARQVLTGALTTGELLLIIGYVAQIYGPLQQIGTHVTGQQRALASAERAFALMDAPATVAERPDARPLDRAAGHVRLEAAGFAYPGQAPVLDNISIDIPAGTSVGIVGRTGAGKSTLVNLVLRQMDVASGRILLDGEDLRDLRLPDLRRQFAVVPQDCTLFSTTIAENIAYGDPGASMARIVAAARQASAHDFIMALPDGYRTQVGERGTRLSGGERQRIAIARAFLTDAPILVMDEPTSAIDAATELAIVEAMERLMAGRTTFIIAHRLSTLRQVDLVLRVEGGRVSVEREAVPALRLAS
jgi:ATP-binding cassette subfamily B protein